MEGLLLRRKASHHLYLTMKNNETKPNKAEQRFLDWYYSKRKKAEVMESKEVEVTTRTNKCETCGKRYKFPQTVFEPRERICFTCEVKENIKDAFESVYLNL